MAPPKGRKEVRRPNRRSVATSCPSLSGDSFTHIGQEIIQQQLQLICRGFRRQVELWAGGKAISRKELGNDSVVAFH